MKTFNADDLGAANIDEQSRYADFSEMVEGEDFDVLTPDISVSILDEYFSDWQDSQEVAEHAKDTSPYWEDDQERALRESAMELFEEQDGFYTWRDSLFPMMNFVWPVYIKYGLSEEEAATNIASLGIACTLLRMNNFNSPESDDAYAIALTGGGMNLADHISLAYIACGQIPPWNLIAQLPFPLDAQNEKNSMLRESVNKLAECYEHRALRSRDIVKLFD